MAEAAGQRRVKVALRNLWRRHEAEETGYLQFMDVVEALSEEDLERLREYGVEDFIELEGEPYIILDVDKARRLLAESGGDE